MSQKIQSLSGYYHEYQKSIHQPEQFWSRIAQGFHWKKPWDNVLSWNFEGPEIKWFENAKLNITENIFERHLFTHGDKTAIIWEPNEPNEAERRISYSELYEMTCQFSNALESQGIQKGDRVIIYMPMIPEAAVAMLACARVGAVHSVVFAGFSSTALADRIKDCEAKMVLTADGNFRGTKNIPVKAVVDEALTQTQTVEKVIVYQRTQTAVEMKSGRDLWWHEVIANEPKAHTAATLDAEDLLFILYTSGSTGKPKGVLHTTGGYLVYASFTHKYSFDYHPGDVYWCTADAGWITGHSYSLYGPLANGAQTLLFEGVPNYPDFSRFWQVCDKHNVNIFYTAPTAIRALMKEGNDFVTQCDLSSLRILGTVGEPINPEAWNWYSSIVGKDKCPVVDTWWQTETGGHLISPIPGVTKLKPGSATHPYFGIEAAIVDDNGNILEGECEGKLCMLDSWPGQMRTVYGNHQRFVETYFSQFKGKYFTGDGCRRDKDGFYWITGRVDDCINVSGHLLGTAEIESAFVEHALVSEAAVVGYPHDIKGQGIYAYVTTNTGVEVSDELKKELTLWIRQKIGPIATPDKIQFAPGLPKTRSGKIMRRILRKIASHEEDQLGDTSTLADPGVVQSLIDGSKDI